MENIENAPEEVVETPIEEVVEGAPVEETVEGGEPAEPEAYAPNYGFKVKDQEMEFDDWAKPLVTNKEVEAKLRETFEKAHGIEEIKTQRQTLRDEVKDHKEWRSTMEGSLNQMSTYLKNKDFGSFMKAMGIPEELVVGHVLNQLKYEQMSPEQRQEFDYHRTNQERLSTLEVQNQTLVSEQQRFVQEQQTFELENALSQPDVQQIAQAYDARQGQVGAFKKAVVERGIYHEYVSSTTISVQQAVGEVVGMIGQVQAPGMPAGTPPQAGQQVVQQNKPVIPNFAGQSGNSPVKKQVRSIEDIRQLQQELASREA